MQEIKDNNDHPEQENLQWNSSTPGEPEAADYYMNDSGFVVFTAKYLLERGYCCGNGCLNCPYDYKAVPEPRRSKLLEQRKNNTNNAT